MYRTVVNITVETWEAVGSIHGIHQSAHHSNANILRCKSKFYFWRAKILKVQFSYRRAYIIVYIFLKCTGFALTITNFHNHCLFKPIVMSIVIAINSLVPQILLLVVTLHDCWVFLIKINYVFCVLLITLESTTHLFIWLLTGGSQIIKLINTSTYPNFSVYAYNNLFVQHLL